MALKKSLNFQEIKIIQLKEQRGEKKTAEKWTEPQKPAVGNIFNNIWLKAILDKTKSEKIFEKIISENFQNLMKNTNLLNHTA